MASPLLWTCRLVAALGLLAQGILLWRAPLPGLALVALAVVISAALVAHGRRAAVVVAVAAQFGLAVAAVAPSLESSPDDDAWRTRQHARVGAALDREAAAVAELPVRLEQAADASRANCPTDSALTATPFAVVAAWENADARRRCRALARRRTRGMGAGGGAHPATVPRGTARPDPGRRRLGAAAGCRSAGAGPSWRAELQVALADDDGTGLRREVVAGGHVGAVQWQGDAARGITGTRDVAIGPRDATGRQPYVRLSLAAPPRGATDERAAAGRRLALLMCLAAGALAGGAALAGGTGLSGCRLGRARPVGGDRRRPPLAGDAAGGARFGGQPGRPGLLRDHLRPWLAGLGRRRSPVGGARRGDRDRPVAALAAAARRGLAGGRGRRRGVGLWRRRRRRAARGPRPGARTGQQRQRPPDRSRGVLGLVDLLGLARGLAPVRRRHGGGAGPGGGDAGIRPPAAAPRAGGCRCGW